jgi:hypothetical protein
MSARLALDIGDHAQGLAIDPGLWEHESRVRTLKPPRHITGRVRGVWPYAPHVVCVTTATGEAVVIRVVRP